jgi:CRP-like cAMP-binding protein
VIEVDLRRFSLFAHFGHEDLEAIAAQLEIQELAREQPLWREGEGAEGLVLLEKGALRIETQRGGALGRCEAPACFGAASLVGDGLRECTAIAADPGRVLLLSRTAFARLIEDAPRAAARLLAAIAADLARTLREGLPFVT